MTAWIPAIGPLEWVDDHGVALIVDVLAIAPPDASDPWGGSAFVAVRAPSHEFRVFRSVPLAQTHVPAFTAMPVTLFDAEDLAHVIRAAEGR